MFMLSGINSTVTYPSWVTVIKILYKTHLEKQKALCNIHEPVINKTLSHRVVPSQISSHQEKPKLYTLTSTSPSYLWV